MAGIRNLSVLCVEMGLTAQRGRTSATRFALPGTWVLGAPLSDGG
jgi:hypothetical protein